MLRINCSGTGCCFFLAGEFFVCLFAVVDSTIRVKVIFILNIFVQSDAYVRTHVCVLSKPDWQYSPIDSGSLICSLMLLLLLLFSSFISSFPTFFLYTFYFLRATDIKT